MFCPNVLSLYSSSITQQLFIFLNFLIQALSNCFIQLKKALSGYENLQKSIVPPIVELRRRKVPESQIRLAVKDKENAVYQYSFETMQVISDVLKSFTDEMKKGLKQSVEDVLKEKLR